MSLPERPFRQIFEITKSQREHPDTRPAVRDSIHKATLCRTPALGGEVYASATCEKVFYHTCKSKCCPSCGNRGTIIWQRDQWAALPDIPFVGIVFTMPNVFWPVFRAHRHLQHDLAALGAAVVEEWAWTRYGVRLYIMVITHTFGGRLSYHPHLHILVSAGGLKHDARWVKSLKFDIKTLMELWRFAVTAYLCKAKHNGHLLQHSLSPVEFDEAIHIQMQRAWNIHISQRMSKDHFLRYAGRYVRRLPISEKRILNVTEREVVYQSKDTRTKGLVVDCCTPAEFFARFSQHVLDRYEHSMRYFGLLAPRTKGRTSAATFALLGQKPRPKPKRQNWAASLIKHFGIDPLVDARGDRMNWVRHQAPIPETPLT